ncbi:MAG: MFS transporter [Alphaproteobacteria bacterium]|nr:MFS transporter [Alphaproteobacteria bacterium]
MSVAAVSFRHDLRVTGLVGLAHAFSHFFQLCFAPLFPLIKAELGVSYALLGLLMTLFYGASGLCQTPAGFLVDRFGARPVLLTGLGLLAGAVTAASLAPNFWLLLPLAVLAGIGNSVFHPADLAILTAKIAPTRLGRAYGVHSLAGNLGWAAAPATVIFLSQALDWRTALLAVGLGGLAVTLFLTTQHDTLATEGKGGAKRSGAGASVLLRLPILTCFAFFALLALALIGVQTFGPTTLQKLYPIDVTSAAAALTVFLVASAGGIAVGGVLADRTSQHHLVAIAGMGAAALLMAALSLGALPAPAVGLAMAAAGFAIGITNPSRDMLVRQATPPGASGRVFGFVYSGLDLGSSAAPLLFGWMLDHGLVMQVLLAIALLQAFSILTVLQVRRNAMARAPA